ncbi:MAG TPA: histone deacetylase [Solirubrobacteraceae bacterium]|jgi:acetoin utilization deacetylase AcuC-like enzyme|nr:histone deacetylase [Solirubrobacteraceae bacterium]
MPVPVLLRHPSSVEHDTGPHPESPRRIVAIEQVLGPRDWLGWDVRLSPAAPRAAIEAIHPPSHVDRVEALAARGGGMIDAETIVSAGSYEAALHAAGGAIAVVDALLGPERAPAAASLHRPPGHHATARHAMGFCLFNNVAIAAQHALAQAGAERVMIVDWDVHHGNGTNDIFAERDDVLFCSIHQSPLYPGTGAARDVGRGAGEGYTVNLPVPGGSGDAVFVSLVEHVVRPLARAYEPDLVLISAGYDAHADDPLAGCEVTDSGYAAMSASLRAMADKLGAPLGIVLEGGYDLGALARGVAITLAVVGAEQAPPVAQVAVHPLATRALQRLAGRHWPVLA